MCTFGLVTLHPTILRCFSDNDVITKTYNISYWYKKYVCIYACCVIRTELLVGQAGKSSACIMYINIDIDKYMLSFYIIKCLDEQREMYDSLNAQLSPMCFQPVF